MPAGKGVVLQTCWRGCGSLEMWHGGVQMQTGGASLKQGRQSLLSLCSQGVDAFLFSEAQSNGWRCCSGQARRGGDWHLLLLLLVLPLLLLQLLRLGLLRAALLRRLLLSEVATKPELLLQLTEQLRPRSTHLLQSQLPLCPKRLPWELQSLRPLLLPSAAEMLGLRLRATRLLRPPQQCLQSAVTTQASLHLLHPQLAMSLPILLQWRACTRRLPRPSLAMILVLLRHSLPALAVAMVCCAHLAPYYKEELLDCTAAVARQMLQVLDKQVPENAADKCQLALPEEAPEHYSYRRGKRLTRRDPLIAQVCLG